MNLITRNIEIVEISDFIAVFMLDLLNTACVSFVGPWSNGYQCLMEFSRPRFNSQRATRSRILTLGKLANLKPQPKL